MPVDRLRRSNGSRSRARGKVVAVLLAAAWLAFLTILGAHSFLQAPSASANSSIDSHVSLPSDCTTPSTMTPATCTPTSTPTDTSTAAPTDTPRGRPTSTPSATTTVAPTATTSDGGGGGNVGGNPNDPGSGGQATKVVLAQPTYGTSADNSGQGISIASFGSNGLLFASLMSCIVGLLGIVVAVIAIRILRRDGYGPFLRALLLGKRANQQPRAKGAVAASKAGSVSRAAWSTDDRDDFSGERQSFSGNGVRAPSGGAGRRPPSRPNASRSRSSRPDW